MVGSLTAQQYNERLLVAEKQIESGDYSTQENLEKETENWLWATIIFSGQPRRELIGNYERNENLPSIEMAARMAKAFGVTVDFLIGEGENASYDKQPVERINDIQKMDADTKSILFNVSDA